MKRAIALKSISTQLLYGEFHHHAGMSRYALEKSIKTNR